MKRQEYRRRKKLTKRKRIALFSLIGIVAAFVIGLISLRIYAQVAGAPPLTVPKATIFQDSEGQQIGDYYTGERRYWVDLEEISPYLQTATVAVEDKDFFDHNGFDYMRIGGAILADIKAGSKVQGASTLTQQYARNLYLTHEKSWMRKLNEALYAYRIETFYSKEEILEGYLNTVYYGHGMYGAEAASRYYFGKSANELSLAEAAMLAGIPKGPSIYSPIVNPEKATNRQQLILRIMNDQEKISAEERQTAVAQPLVFKNDAWSDTQSLAPYFLDTVWKEASDILEKQNLNIGEGGWTIQTTLNTSHQKAAEQAVQKNMPNSDLQVAFVSMKPKTGEVTALVGGKSYSESNYNRTTLSKRQPGSTIKPFLYTAALIDGESPLTFKDVSETTFEYDRGRQQYTPTNASGKYAERELSMAQALAVSDNVYAVRTLQDIGYDAFNDTLENFKLPTSDKEEPSLALGTTESTLYKLVSAYNVFPSNGEYIKPTTILSIANASGEIIYEYKPSREEVISKADTAVMTDMMTGIFDNVYSNYSPATGASLRYQKTHTYAAKSGTTNTDQWMIGFSTRLTAGVWNGYDQGKTLSVEADKAAAKQVWIDFMESTHKGLADEKFEAPSGVEAVKVDIVSGKLATNACSDYTRTIYIKEDQVPTESCKTNWIDQLTKDPDKNKDDSEKSTWEHIIDWFKGD